MGVVVQYDMPRPETISTKTFNGTLAAFARARAELGKESFIESLPEGYRLAYAAGRSGYERCFPL